MTLLYPEDNSDLWLKNMIRICLCVPVDTGRKLNVHKTSWTSSERLMYVKITSYICGVSNVLFTIHLSVHPTNSDSNQIRNFMLLILLLLTHYVLAQCSKVLSNLILSVFLVHDYYVWRCKTGVMLTCTLYSDLFYMFISMAFYLKAHMLGDIFESKYML